MVKDTRTIRREIAKQKKKIKKIKKKKETNKKRKTYFPRISFTISKMTFFLYIKNFPIKIELSGIQISQNYVI